MIINILWFVFFWLGSVKLGAASGIVINSTVNPVRSSLNFLIPIAVPFNHYWPLCKKRSKYYCLTAFVTEEDIYNPAFHVRTISGDVVASELFGSHLNMLKRFVREECDDLFESVYEDHNHFVVSEGCCQGQYFYYFTYGFREALLTPMEYLTKLFDYSEEDKQLNYILSFYEPGCHANIITKIGFGIGELKRDNHGNGFRDERHGIPYLLKVGDNWTPRIPYENPIDFITFSWFKSNVMCPDQPWICQNQRNSSIKRVVEWWQRFFRYRRNYTNLIH